MRRAAFTGRIPTRLDIALEIIAAVPLALVLIVAALLSAGVSCGREAPPGASSQETLRQGSNPPARQWEGEDLVIEISALEGAASPRPLGDFFVMAHRGAPSVVTENSVESILLASVLGANSVECDARMSADGIPILCHDDDLLRLTGREGRISELTAGEVTGGYRLRPNIPLRRLDDALPIILEGFDAVFVEGKTTGDPALDTEFGGRLAEAVRASAGGDRVYLTSYSLDILRAAHESDPDILIAFDGYWGEAMDYIEELGIDLRFTDHTVLDTREMEALHALGIPTVAYTVNDPDRMRELIDLGVDGILTDDIPALLGVMEGGREG